MIYRIISLFASVCFFGCKDLPYVDDKIEQPVESKEYTFSGTAEVGTPVSSAKVYAFEFKNLLKGKIIGETITERDGNFNLNIKTNYDGPVLLSTSGGLYKDLVTGETVALKPDQELRSAITHIKMPERTNINAWTTMAISRALADRGFWDKNVAQLKDIDRINIDFAHMSYFLTGKSPGFVNIRRHEFFDITKDNFKPEDPKVMLHLAHGGLSKLASDYSALLAEEGVVISVLDLVLALAEDLSDRIFDGRNAKGGVVYVGKNHHINLSSYTMRKNLSEAILLYLQYLQSRGKLTEEDRYYLEKPDKIIDSISKETQPELFPESEAPKPIDKESPSLEIHFTKEHSRERPFAFLNGNVVFDVEAFDDTKVKEIRLLEPGIVGQKTGNNFGPIFVNQVPQAMRAAQVCEKEIELRADLVKRELNEANVICACFEAMDIFGNSEKKLSCFQRALPRSIISFPTEKTVLSKKKFDEGVKITANITSGLPITECSWHIRAHLEGEVEEGVLPSGQGIINGTTCAIEEHLDGSKFFNGTYYLVVEAKDLGERVLSDLQDSIYQSVTSFQVFKEPPAITVTSPINNDLISTDYIPVFGTVKEPDKIKEVSVCFRGTGLDNKDSKGCSFVPIDSNKKDWSIYLGSGLKSGDYSFEITVIDIYGNERKYPSKNMTIDQQYPLILGSSDGVPQNPYLQETMNFRQRLIEDNKDDPRYLIEPVGEALSINWSKTPRISRWLSRLNDWRTAPSYTVKVKDDNKLKEVRYKLYYKCVPLEDADQIAQMQQDERYEIWLTQNAASFDLARDSESDGHMQKYCLSIWAIDQAGNASNHNVEFIWKVIVPPITIDMNSGRYRAHTKYDDLSSINKTIPELFVKVNPIALKKNQVLGHAILSNSFSEQLSAKLEMKNAINFSLKSKNYPIPDNLIDIRYFAYDLAKDEVGPEKTLNDKSVLLNANETVIAKFILGKNFIIDGFESKEEDFWKTLCFEVGFSKNGMEKPLVNGLKLITRDPFDGKLSSEFPVFWGIDHDVRKRRPPRFVQSI